MSLLILPVLVHMALVLALVMTVGMLRYRAVQSRQVRIGAIALSNDAWPVPVRKFSNNLANQFETPIIFYGLVAIAVYAGIETVLTTICAWGYVLSRFAHTTVHVTTNHIFHRFLAFATGVAFLVVMLGRIVVGLIPQLV